MSQFAFCLESGDQALREGRYADAEQALTAGALGFTTSRTVFHKTARGEYVPNFGAAARELNAIAAVLLGDDEIAKGVATVRDMTTGAQEQVSLEQLASRLAAFGR